MATKAIRPAHWRMAEVAFNTLPKPVARKLGAKAITAMAEAFRERLGDVENGYVAATLDDEAEHYIMFREVKWARSDIDGSVVRVWVMRATNRERFK